MADTEIVEGYTPNFEAWIKDFNEWQTRIGFDPSWLGDYTFDIKFDWDTAGNTIEFGDFETGSDDDWEPHFEAVRQKLNEELRNG